MAGVHRCSLTSDPGEHNPSPAERVGQPTRVPLDEVRRSRPKRVDPASGQSNHLRVIVDHGRLAAETLSGEGAGVGDGADGADDDPWVVTAACHLDDGHHEAEGAHGQAGDRGRA